MIVKETPFKPKGGLKAGFRVLLGVIEIKTTTPIGVKYLPCFKQGKEQWTWRNCPNQIKSFEFFGMTKNAIAGELDISLSYCEQIKHGFAVITDEMQTRINKLEQKLKGEENE
jgi:hypothetical protein